MKIKRFSTFLFIIFLALSVCVITPKNTAKAKEMPFYDLHPSNIVLRAEFCTDFSTSSIERKHNITLACKSIDNYFLDVGGEFSFNKVVGQRTEKRGYKKAKIILNGEFVDGVGGGVCQVSTTLYNAVLLANLCINEYHPHSLAVSYVPASFDAMVNSNTADLRFTNNTHNPIIIKAKTQNDKLKIQIFGEKLGVLIATKSVITGTILPPPYLELKDDKGEYPELYEGESKLTRHQKNGIKSEGYLLIKQNGKILERKKIRTDTYSAIQGILVHGTTPRPLPINEDFSQKICDEFCPQ